jgi:2-aminoadipate transaminase
MEAVKTTNYDPLLSTRAKLELPTSPLIANRRGAAPALAPLYQFGGGFPDPDSFPFQGLIEANAAMLASEGRDALTYGALYGYQGLRELVCAKTRHYDGFEISPDNVLVTNGSSHALSLAADLLVDVGDPVIVEAPTFSGTLYNFRRYGPELIGVSLDDEGIRTDELEDKLKGLQRQGRRAKLIYTIVNFQNPAGMTQSLRRRTELLDLAEKYDTVILEDDAYGELRYDGEPIRSLFGLDRSNRVMRAGTLSKILGAGVRLGWLLAPKELIPKLAVFKTDGGTNPYMSRLATYYMRDHMLPHVEELRAIYRRKRDTMLDRLRAGLGDTAQVSRPDGGFFIWIRLPEGTDPAKLVELGNELRISFVPGPAFFPDGSSGSEYIRLAFSFATVDAIREGTDLLCEAIHAAK